jgi:hypothetical protein
MDVLVQLGHSSSSRSEAWHAADLTSAVTCCQLALEMPQSAPVRNFLYGVLGKLRVLGHHLTGGLEDLFAGMATYDWAFNGGQLDRVHRDGLQNNDGLALYQLQVAAGACYALNAAIGQFNGSPRPLTGAAACPPYLTWASRRGRYTMPGVILLV